MAVLLDSGKTLSQASEELTVSPETTKTHRRNILRKTKANSTEDLIEILAKLRGGEFESFCESIMISMMPPDETRNGEDTPLE